MDDHGTDQDFAPRFWELLEDAFNKTMVENFTRLKGIENEKTVYTLDDDKLHFGYCRLRDVVLGSESGLKRLQA